MTQKSPTRTQTGAQRREARKAAAMKREQQQRMLRLVIGAGVAAVVVVVFLIFLNRTEDAPEVDYSGLAFSPPPAVALDSTTDAATPVASAEPASGDADALGATLGDANAPVTMVVYADYQCPFCKQFALEMQPKIVQDFVRTGDVRLEFVEFPILGGDDLTSEDNESAQSAEAVLCAAEQGSYLQYHDKLYANQSGENNGAFSDNRLKSFAGDLGLDESAFGDCLSSGKYEPTLEQMKANGQSLGITGTPMFVINGQVISLTAQGYGLLEKQIQTAVDQAG